MGLSWPLPGPLWDVSGGVFGVQDGTQKGTKRDRKGIWRPKGSLDGLGDAPGTILEPSWEAFGRLRTSLGDISGAPEEHFDSFAEDHWVD